VFENIPTVKDFKILSAEDETVALEGSKNAREAALPGKPAAFFY